MPCRAAWRGVRLPRCRAETTRIPVVAVSIPAAQRARLPTTDCRMPPPNLPVLVARIDGHGAPRSSLERPRLSVIVISRDDEDTIERSVRSVLEQDCPVRFEVIVVTSGSDRTPEIVRERFPEVTVVQLATPALPGAARNAGLAIARGTYVSFPGSHVELPQGSLAARFRAHELGHAMVSGTAVNGTTTRSGWASYFLDHSRNLPGQPSGELSEPPVRCSYRRELLLEVGGFPERLRAGEDTVVNRQLWRRGHRAYLAPEVEFVHRSPCTGPFRLLRHHFRRGSAAVRVRLDGVRRDREVPRGQVLRFVLRYPQTRLTAIDQRLKRCGPELESRYRRVRPLVALGILAAWAGMWAEFLRPRPRARAGSAPHGRSDARVVEVNDGDRSHDHDRELGCVAEPHVAVSKEARDRYDQRRADEHEESPAAPPKENQAIAREGEEREIRG
jgi:glycosyltransferase involved in cell wall biosynthesis